ncbi:MAG: GNAT family N-acetyltransferase [Minisyncoccia bacterium]
MKRKFLIIHHLPEERWKEYKALRIKAVKVDPLAFGLTEAEELKKSDKEWKHRLKSDASVQMIFVESEGTLVGMIGLFKETLEKIRHLSKILSFFVDPQYRGNDIGKLLLEEVITCLKADKEVKKITLSVTTTQKSAIGLYKKYGFKITGVLHEELCWKKDYYDQYLMEYVFN